MSTTNDESGGPRQVALAEGLGVGAEARKCSHCRFPLPASDSGLRHYGTHTAHQESECLRLLSAEIERLRADLAKLQEPVEDAQALRLRYPGAIAAIVAAEHEACISAAESALISGGDAGSIMLALCGMTLRPNVSGEAETPAKDQR